MGNLLKELLRALRQFGWYQIKKFFGHNSVNGLSDADKSLSALGSSVRPAASIVSAQVATPALIDELSDIAGLDPSYEQRIPWPAYRTLIPPQELLSDELYQLWRTIPRGHKWTHYFSIYEAVFGSRRAEPLRILEIGILVGASLQLWRRYFTHPDTVIVGIDILPACSEFDSPAEGIRVRIGSQTDAAFLQRVVEEFGPFDLIIDDGSHHSSHMISSFNSLYSEGLKDAGIYFVEDLHANYWLPWRDSRLSFLDLCKELIEHMHAQYESAPPGAFMINKAPDQPMESLNVPRITTMIREIRFFDSIVAIYKARREYIPYYLRQEV